MPSLNERKLLNLIRYAPVLIIGLFAIAVNIVLIQNNRLAGAQSVQLLREDMIDRQKELIREQVNQAFQQIQLERNHTLQYLKEQAKSRVNEAYDIANSIYVNNPHKSKQELTKMIADALRPIRFFNGRGYFFIFQMDGVNVMHPLKPYLEGTSAWDSVDSRGRYILREHITLIKESGGEAFYHWWYQKYGEPTDVEFEKVGFGKQFEPLNWFIGTGEYLADVSQDVQSSMLAWVSRYHYGDDGYLFVLDKHGKVLSHPDRKTIGTAISESFNTGIQQLFATEESHAGFVQYSSKYMPGEPNGGEKISYLRTIDGWDWIIGTGFYVKNFEQYLAKKQQFQEESNQRGLIRISILSTICSLLVMVISIWVGRLIAQRFKNFQQRINHDFGELEKAKDKMQFMALHDALTGLPNRSLLADMINNGIELARRKEKNLAVMFVDLDDFKKINDLYGHSVGDQLLEMVSHKFQALLDEGETVSRFGGDEFIFCFPDLIDKKAAEAKVERINNVFHDQFVLNGKILTIHCSIGISMYPTDSESSAGLIRKADIVLHKSKVQNKGKAMFYDDRIDAEVQFDYLVEEELRRAIYKNEISVLYQPQVDLKTGNMVGVEALARWNSKRLGSVSPAKFIAVAEATGLIFDIGLFIFRQACEDILSVSANGPDSLSVSINLSPKQLMQTSIKDDILDIIDKVGIDINRITLEITENVLFDDLDTVSIVLEQLRLLGFGISLDDFGTGYSSLRYLNNLPISEIKIDRCFVEKLMISDQSDTLVRAIIAIGHSCKLTVVAEGVETFEQYDTLMTYGCSLIQGYYYDRPLPIEQVCKRLHRRAIESHG
jgi:diguanylate cyclase (GGDEF)-like protein